MHKTAQHVRPRRAPSKTHAARTLLAQPAPARSLVHTACLLTRLTGTFTYPQPTCAYTVAGSCRLTALSHISSTSAGLLLCCDPTHQTQCACQQHHTVPCICRLNPPVCLLLRWAVLSCANPPNTHATQFHPTALDPKAVQQQPNSPACLLLCWAVLALCPQRLLLLALALLHE